MKVSQNFNNSIKKIHRIIFTMFSVMIVIIIVTATYTINPSIFIFEEERYTKIVEEDEDRIENGFHVRTGFVDDEGLMTVINNCTNCHSAKLVTQNRMTKSRWQATIKWMQKTQNLWDLGKNEEIILNYLAKNYAPNNKGRRENLSGIDWYELE